MEPQKAPENISTKQGRWNFGAKKFALCCTALSERQKNVENPNVSLQPWRSQNVKFVIFWLNFREIAWNLRDLRGLRGTCVACVEPAWLVWNLRALNMRGLRGTCVACVEPAWNLRGLRGTCVRGTCVACVQPAWHLRGLRGTTCMEKPENYLFFPLGTAKIVKTAENATITRKMIVVFTWGEKTIVVSRGVFCGLHLLPKRSEKFCPHAPKKDFFPKNVFWLGWLGKVRKGGFGLLPMILIQRNHFFAPRSKSVHA